MEVLQNTKDVHFMVWETDPRKRNKNNIIKLNETSREILNGDIIWTRWNDFGFSTYEVLDVLSRRDSSMKNMQYCEIKTKFKYMSPLEFLSITDDEILKGRIETFLEKQKTA